MNGNSSRRTPRSSEKGAFIAVMTFGLLALLITFSIVVDVAQLYWVKQRMQKAADMGVLAGLTYRIRQGPTIDDASVIARAREIVERNLPIESFRPRSAAG